MASKFFRLSAAFMFAILFAFRPAVLWAQEDAAVIDLSDEEKAAADSGLATDSGAASEAVAEEAAAPESIDHKTSRYEISAIEDAAEGKNYYVTKDENNKFRFVQKLSWNKIPDIKNYRITIERLTDAGWVQVLENDLVENKIEVSLDAGKYRFQVSVINLFDQLEKSSDWQNFEVLKALQPSIDNLQTDSMYLSSKKADGTFTLNGKNLNENTIFTMGKRDCEPPKILHGRVLSLAEDGSSAQVQFDISQIDEGKYEIYAQNPGGLSVISKTLHIKNKKEKMWRVMASAGYAPCMDAMNSPLSKYRKKTFYPIGVNARVTYIVVKTKLGDLGFNVGANYSYFSADTTDYKMKGNYFSALGGLTYQKFFTQKFALDLHGGAGLACLFGVNFTNNYTSQTSPNLDAMGLAFGGGLAIQYHFVKHLYLETGVDFTYAMFKDIAVGMLSPSISVGGRF